MENHINAEMSGTVNELRVAHRRHRRHRRRPRHHRVAAARPLWFRARVQPRRERCQASWVSMPSRSDTCGCQPRSLTRAVDRATVAPGVAGFDREGVDGDGRAGDLADQHDEIGERDLGTAGEVDDRARRDVGRGRGEVAGDDVGDVGELPDLACRRRSAGTVAARQRGLAQPVDRHVGPLAGAEHREVAQRRPSAAPSCRRRRRTGARRRASSRRRG